MYSDSFPNWSRHPRGEGLRISGYRCYNRQRGCHITTISRQTRKDTSTTYITAAEINIFTDILMVATR